MYPHYTFKSFGEIISSIYFANSLNQRSEAIVKNSPQVMFSGAWCFCSSGHVLWCLMFLLLRSCSPVLDVSASQVMFSGVVNSSNFNMFLLHRSCSPVLDVSAPQVTFSGAWCFCSWGHVPGALCFCTLGHVSGGWCFCSSGHVLQCLMFLSLRSCSPLHYVSAPHVMFSGAWCFCSSDHVLLCFMFLLEKFELVDGMLASTLTRPH